MKLMKMMSPTNICMIVMRPSTVVGGYQNLLIFKFLRIFNGPGSAAGKLSSMKACEIAD